MDSRAGRVASILDDLDRALGRRFDLRAEFTPPERWSDTRELYQESSDAAVFMAAVEHMLDRLIVELRRRQVASAQLEDRFRAPASTRRLAKASIGSSPPTSAAV